MAGSRNASASLAGYLYQLEKSAIEVALAAPTAQVLLEGMEDIDLFRDDHSVFVQCKYHEAQSYSPALIRKAILPMLSSHARGVSGKYRLYAHFSSKGSVPPGSLTIKDLKSLLIENKRDGRIDHGSNYTDTQLLSFLNDFEIISGPSILDQRHQLIDTLAAMMMCSVSDAEQIHYGNALAFVADRAVRADEASRTVTNADLRLRIDVKDALYLQWREEALGIQNFVKELTPRLRNSGWIAPTRVRALFLTLGGGGLGRVQEVAAVGEWLANVSYYKNGRALDTSIPWTLILDGDPGLVDAIKRALVLKKVVFQDGFEDYGFNLDQFLRAPVVNRKNRSRVVEISSYHLRLVTMETLRTQGAGRVSFETLISVGPKSQFEGFSFGQFVKLANIDSSGIMRLLGV